MTTAVDDTRNCIDERIARHASIDEVVELIDVVPSTDIIALNIFKPRKHPCNPFELFVFFACAYGIWLLAEVNIGITRPSSFVSSPFPQKIVQFSKITNSCCLNHAAPPETATLDIGTPSSAGHRRIIHKPPCLLSIVNIAVLWRICPWCVALFRIVPISCKWMR